MCGGDARRPLPLVSGWLRAVFYSLRRCARRLRPRPTVPIPAISSSIIQGEPFCGPPPVGGRTVAAVGAGVAAGVAVGAGVAVAAGVGVGPGKLVALQPVGAVI